MLGNESIGNLKARLEQAGQSQLLRFWDRLNDQQQSALAAQLEKVDFEEIKQLIANKQEGANWAELAYRATPPPAVRLDGSGIDLSKADASKIGKELLSAGKVGMILVAGGQGTRLGFDQPKGMYPIGPVSNRTLFQVIADQLLAKAAHYGISIPLFVMTSPATHEETVNYFKSQANLGLAESDLRVFCQGTMPAVDAESGECLLADVNSLALSPDGHGGMLKAFADSGCLAMCQERGIEHLFYAQIDNPLVNVGDEVLLGYHQHSGSEMTTQVVQKVHPLERVGNVVELDSKVQIIEYSDLPDDVAKKTDDQGNTLLWAGNIAVHLFRREFLERMHGLADALPFHLANKKVPFLDEQGKSVEPEQPNAIKFERFIFDLLPHAKNAIAVEASKSESFAPVKNAKGSDSDSPDLAQEAMVALHRGWLAEAGVEVTDGVAVEISPLFALDADELKTKTLPSKIEAPTFLQP